MLFIITVNATAIRLLLLQPKTKFLTFLKVKWIICQPCVIYFVQIRIQDIHGFNKKPLFRIDPGEKLSCQNIENAKKKKKKRTVHFTGNQIIYII